MSPNLDACAPFPATWVVAAQIGELLHVFDRKTAHAIRPFAFRISSRFRASNWHLVAENAAPAAAAGRSRLLAARSHAPLIKTGGRTAFRHFYLFAFTFLIFGLDLEVTYLQHPMSEPSFFKSTIVVQKDDVDDEARARPGRDTKIKVRSEAAGAGDVGGVGHKEPKVAAGPGATARRSSARTHSAQRSAGCGACRGAGAGRRGT